jgi:hypothetical protein
MEATYYPKHILIINGLHGVISQKILYRCENLETHVKEEEKAGGVNQF